MTRRRRREPDLLTPIDQPAAAMTADEARAFADRLRDPQSMSDLFHQIGEDVESELSVDQFVAAMADLAHRIECASKREAAQ
jgi:hypothetical protein